MKLIRATEFTGQSAWDAIDIASMNGVSTRLHWTDQPYHWHINDGDEVFAVLDGVVEMRYRENGEEKMELLKSGDIFFAAEGTEHVAHPRIASRILVVEYECSE